MEEQSAFEDLLVRAQEGDRAALDALIGRERPRLEGFVRSRLGEGLARRIEVDDVLQEALLRAVRDFAGFVPRGDDSLFRWLSGIALHVIQEAASRFGRARAVGLDSDVPARGPSPSHLLRRIERFDRLQAALDRLSAEHREVIRLVRIEGLPVREVAKRMGRTPHAVSNLLLRATRRLREFLGDTDSLSLPDRRLRDGEGTSDA
ncbi:MAG: sigma-70 family RNA polymerase sigma factor [Planctomycetes bacterium]|nr:sigma-70 family RNA polymerase sigma factor [Planctomycetota bacterium]